MLFDSSTQIASIQVQNGFTVERDFLTVQINTSHLCSTILSSNHGTRQDKTVLKRIHRATRSCSDRHYSNTNLRLHANFLMGYRDKIFSPVSRNNVTRSPGLTETYSLGLPCTSLILDVWCYDQLTPVKTSYPLTSIT